LDVPRRTPPMKKSSAAVAKLAFQWYKSKVGVFVEGFPTAPLSTIQLA
jgi:hypothetical protein